MRIAWLGLAPVDDSGTSYIGTQLLRELTARGVEIHCYAAVAEDAIHPTLRDRPNLRLVCAPSQWRRDRWYSRTPIANHLSLQAMRVRAQARLAKSLVEEHRRRPYDVIYHFSQIELFRLKRYRRELPPIVVHPGAHAAGELYWHRKETALARSGESLSRHLIVRSMLQFRATTQRRDLRFVDMVVVPSRRFASQLREDYALPSDLVRTVPNPIDLDRFSLGERRAPQSSEPVTLLFISRIAVRKGVELIVELSRRLSDLAGNVRIEVIGPQDQWSDYRHLFSELQPEIARYHGNLPALEIAARYKTAHGLLQPSYYEPFALTVGEALASGLPIIASDAVGAIEDLDERCYSSFPAGDSNAFEASVRDLVIRVRDGRAAALAPLARAEAERLWDPGKIAELLFRELEDVVVRRAPTR